MSGVACVGALLQRPMQVVYNSGVVLVFLCRLFSASLPNGIFWFSTGTGTAQCVLALPCDSPLRGVEDLPRETTRTAPVRFLPQATLSPQGPLHLQSLPLNGSSLCATFFGRRHQATGPNWARRAVKG